VCAINESQFRKRRFTISSNWSQPKHHRQQRGVGREKDTLVAAWLPSIFSRADFNHAGRSTFCVADRRACRLCLGNVDSSRNCSVSRCECLANTRRHFSARARLRVSNQTHTTHLEDSRLNHVSVEAQRTRNTRITPQRTDPGESLLQDSDVRTRRTYESHRRRERRRKRGRERDANKEARTGMEGRAFAVGSKRRRVKRRACGAVRRRG
jgi:hypothetical protein